MAKEFKTWRKTKVLVVYGLEKRIDMLVSGSGSRAICIVRLPCLVLVMGSQTKCEHQCDVITLKLFKISIIRSGYPEFVGVYILCICNACTESDACKF